MVCPSIGSRVPKRMHNLVQWHTSLFTGRDLLVLATCYALGCCTAGYYWVRWRTGLDLRLIGSGNVGAKNVARVAGPSGFAVTLLIDGPKGALAVGLADYVAVPAAIVGAALGSVLVCHEWPIQLRFH